MRISLKEALSTAQATLVAKAIAKVLVNKDPDQHGLHRLE